MHAAIRGIFDERAIGAQHSQYDWKVCVRAVAAARDVFECVPIEGTAAKYGQAVTSALEPVYDNYYDSDGEYTSGRSSIGDVYFDISSLL